MKCSSIFTFVLNFGPLVPFSQETEEAITKRLGNAKGEMDAAAEPGLFDITLVNDTYVEAFFKTFGIHRTI